MNQDSISITPDFAEKDRHKVLIEWNDTFRNYPRERSLHRFIEDQVHRTPRAVALVFESEQLTYGQLNARANRLAHYLRKLGVGPEVLVAVCAERSMEMVVALLAIMKAGGAYLPIDPEHPKERLAALLEDARPPVLVAQHRFRTALPQHPGVTVFLNNDEPRFAGEPETNPPVLTTGKNLAYAIYTSGSTGVPKCVLNLHESIVNLMLWMQRTYRLGADDRVLQKTPYTFDVSLLEFFWPLMAGARLVVAKPGGHRDPNYLVDTIAGQHITTANFVPSLLRVFLEASGVERCTSLRHVFSSGEALPSALRDAFFRRLKAQLHNLYGPAEAAVEVTAWSCDRAAPRPTVPIGRPISNTSIYILDMNLQPVPPGVAGELHIGGIALARGYLNRPDLTAQKFIPDPFSRHPGARLYKTGDLARFLPDGAIEYLGRIDHQVKIRGIRVEPAEIEAVLTSHPAVRRAAVVAREDQPGLKRLVAYVVPHNQPVSTGELQQWVRVKLPDFMVPAAFVFLDDLPLTSSGKLDRHRLPPPSQDAKLRRALSPPRNSLESTLCKIWEEVLNVRPIGIDHKFAELGGDSLAAASLFVRVHQIYGKNLQAVDLVDTATVREMAEVLRGQSLGAVSNSLVTLRAGGSRPPLFLISGIQGHVVTFLKLVQHLGPDQPVYALQPPGIDGSVPCLTRLEDLASHYLREIQSQFPSGPYHLAGYSFGGTVVFEMAQQLWARGEPAGLVVLLDALQWRRELRVKRMLRLKRCVFGPQRVAYLRGAARSSRRLLRHNAHSWLHGRPVRNLLTVEEGSRLAANRYTPQVYPGRLILLRTRFGLSPAADDPLLGWGGLAAGGIEVQEIPGGHFDMIEEPHVSVLAQKLEAVLDRVQPKPLVRTAAAGN